MRRIECFDISHTQGEKAVASCVVFDQQGARKTDYRHFNVAPAHAGDDYEALERWAADDFRSINGQLEWLINKALKDAGRKSKKTSGSK